MCGAHKRTGLTEVLRSEYFVPPCALRGKLCGLRRQPFSLPLGECGTAWERPRLPLRREVDACIKDFSRQTEGEIHQVCAKALDIDNGKSKWPLFHSVLVYSSVQTAGSRSLSLSRASKSLGRASSLLRGSRGGSAADHRFALGEHRGAEVRSPFAVRQKIKSHHNFAFWGGMIFAE